MIKNLEKETTVFICNKIKAKMISFKVIKGRNIKKGKWMMWVKVKKNNKNN